MLADIYNSFAIGILFCLFIYHFFLFIQLKNKIYFYYALLLISLIGLVFFTTDVYELFFSQTGFFHFIPVVVLVTCLFLMYALVQFVFSLFHIPKSRLFYIYYFTQLLMIIITTLYLLARRGGYRVDFEFVTVSILVNSLIISLLLILIFSIIKNRSIRTVYQRAIFYGLILLTLLILIKALALLTQATGFFRDHYLFLAVLMLYFGVSLIKIDRPLQPGLKSMPLNNAVESNAKSEKNTPGPAPVEDKIKKPLPPAPANEAGQEEEQFSPFDQEEKIINLSRLINQKLTAYENQIKQKQIIAYIKPDIFIKANPYQLNKMLSLLFEITLQKISDQSKITLLLKTTDRQIELYVRDVPMEAQDSHLNLVSVKLAEFKKTIDSLTGKFFMTQNIHHPGLISFKILLKNHHLLSEDLTHLQQAKADQNKRSIFITLDQPDLIYYLKESLADLYQLFFSTTIEESLEMIQSRLKPDLIMLDLKSQAPLDDFLFQISKIQTLSDVPILMISSKKLEFHNELINQRSGLVHFLLKPYSKQQIKQAIEAILKKEKLQQERKIQKIERKISRALKSSEAAEDPFYEHLKDKCQFYGLDQNQQEMTYLLVKGLEYQEIADQMAAREEHVIEQIQKIFNKVEVDNRIDLINKMIH